MREVPAKLFGFMREMSRRAGADVDRAQAGLALRAVDVDAPGERMDWDEVAIFLERAHGHLPPDRMEAIGETYVQTHVWQQLMARVIGSPRLICEVCFGPLTQAAFPHMRVVLEPTDAGVRWELTLPDRFAPSPFFFRATAGEARALTTLVGRPPAHVEADVGPRHGRYEVAIDEPPRALDRAVRAARHGSDRVVMESIGLMRRMLRAGARDEGPDAPTVLALQRHLGLTHAEARVTSRLAAGLSAKEIARSLGITISTVRSHLKAAYAKTGARGQTELIRLVLTGTWRGAADSPEL